MKTRFWTTLAIGIALPGAASGAPEQDPSQAASARAPMGFIIQCPYLPPELETVPLCQGRKATCVGTDGDDLIWGTEDDEVILGLGGDDVIHADDGDDIVCGGPGDDAVHAARGDDSMYGDEGDDWLFGSRGKDSIYGGLGNRDVLLGGPGLDYLDGGPGDRDVCLQQRDEAKVNVETCEVIFPTAGYNHEKQHAYPPGIVWEAMPGRTKAD